jgi:hypothetical protein
MTEGTPAGEDPVASVARTYRAFARGEARGRSPAYESLAESEPLKVQLETFIDEYRAALHGCLDGLTEEQARRSLIPCRPGETSPSPAGRCR